MSSTSPLSPKHCANLQPPEPDASLSIICGGNLEEVGKEVHGYVVPKGCRAQRRCDPWWWLDGKRVHAGRGYDKWPGAWKLGGCYALLRGGKGEAACRRYIWWTRANHCSHGRACPSSSSCLALLFARPTRLLIRPPSANANAMPIAPITGKLRKRLWMDLSLALGLGISAGYTYWSVHRRQTVAPN